MMPCLEEELLLQAWLHLRLQALPFLACPTAQALQSVSNAREKT